jgi:addiction module HigA family antidote
MIRMARPAHPGQFIRMEVIEPLDLSVTRAAEILGVTRPALSALLNGRASLSPDMALRIEKAFGPKMDTLLRMQTAYDIAEARDREGDIKVQRYVAKPRAGKHPALPPSGS